MISEKYPDKIKYYASMKFDNFIIPDLVMTKEGVACGDHIALVGQLDDDILSFNFQSIDACLFCKAVCNYLVYTFNNQNINDVLLKVKKLYDDIHFEKSNLYRLFGLEEDKYSHRFDCMLSPIKLFFSFIKEISSDSFELDTSKKVDTHKNMECDACVGACKINWNNKNNNKGNNSSCQIKKFDTPYLQKWLPLGKIILSDKEKESLKVLCKNITELDYDFMLSYKIDSIVYYHLLNNCPELISKIWYKTAHRVQKTEVTKGTIERIKNYIYNEKLDVYFIKGYITKKYYENPSFRTHSDYDLVAANSEDAFKLAHYLLKNDFKIRPDLFSIKNMYDLNNTVPSGHFHMRKLIEDTYLLEIDISYPAYPINRINLYYPRFRDNAVCLEDQIIITLLHIFKHYKIYMKDINDMYYMLNEENLDLEYLRDVISKNQLHSFFSLVVMYIYENYDNATYHNRMDKIIEYFHINKRILELYPNWPYDLNMHLNIKKQDYNERTNLNVESNREYLFPIAIFFKELDLHALNFLKKEYSVDKLSDSMYKVSKDGFDFYISSIGIFISNYINTNCISRKNVIDKVKKIMEKIKTGETLFIPYSPKIFNMF